MQKQPFNAQWRFQLSDPTQTSHKGPPDDSTWRVLDLPHDWSIEHDREADAPSGVSNGFFKMGRGTYHKYFEVPEAWRGKKVLVEFEGVYMNAEVWLNENFLGRHPYGYTTFTFDLTPYLKIGQQNRLRVVVDNAAQTNSRWYSGSGIYRPVWLYVAEPVHIAHWGVTVTTEKAAQNSATVWAHVQVINEGETAQQVTVQTRIIGPDHSVCASLEGQAAIEAGGAQVFERELAVTNPQLWSPDSPTLYRLETTVKLGSQTVDTESTAFGIRTIAVDAGHGFLLNGEPLKLKGGCVHHDNGILGSTAYDRAEERKVEIHKASGYNAIRTAHNPPAPSFLDACDRLGMLVLDEAFDCWREGKNPYDYHMFFDDWWERDIESMVLRDRNHPSVVVWSIGNEVMERDGRSGGAAIAKMLADKVRALDPTRPVTSAICGVWDKTHTWEDTDPVFASLDIGGYNYQWRQYEADHARLPGRVIFGTESFPMEAFENWKSVQDHSYVIGDFVWTSLDYLGESGIGRVHFDEENKKFLGDYPWHQANCGDLDICGFKRPQSYYRDILWSVGAKQYIAVHTPVPEGKIPNVTLWGWPDVNDNWTWPGMEGQTFKVDVYSGCEKVELFLNGQSQGVQQVERLTASFEVPYAPGELKAVGYNGGSVSTETVLQTAGDPAMVRLTADREEINADGADLCYVTVEVTDADGCLNAHAAHAIHFAVDGEGEIAAVGSNDPVSTEPYRGDQRRVYKGRCLVVVKSTGRPGAIRLRAEAEGLKPAALVLRAA